MAIIVRAGIIIIFSMLYLISSASPTSWLYNAPRALFGLAGSASASASAPATSTSFIADLRNREAKSAELQKGKEAIGLEPLSEEDGDVENSGDGSNNGGNEASPSLLEKKISKILAKLRLIAQIKNAYHYQPEAHEHDTNITISSQEHYQPNTNTSETQNSTQKQDLIIEPRIVNVKIHEWENIQQIPPADAYGGISLKKEPINKIENPSIVFPQPDRDIKDAPTKIEIEVVNQVNGKLEGFDKETSGKLKEHEPGRLGALGVFFAELVGSIVGLTYGAVAQIASGGQSPVTISTSEGL